MAFKFTELQEKWLQALESGEWNQTTGCLQRQGAYCCLGIACVTLGYQVDVHDEGTVIRPNGMPLRGYLDQEDANLLGLRDGLGSLVKSVGQSQCLYEMNDGGMTFAEIAAYIRANPENVFAKGAE